MNWRVFLGVSLCTGALCTHAFGQAQPKQYTLEECIQLAEKGQIDLVVGRNSLIAAQNRVTQAKSSYLPQISIQNNAFHWGQGVLNRSTNGTALSVNESIWDGGLRETNVESSRYGVAQSEARLSRTTQTTMFNVTKAYYDVLRAKHLEEVAKANVTYTEELKKAIDARIEAGTAANVDVLPVEAQLASARVSLLSANNSVRTASLQLQNAIGLEPTADFDVADVQNFSEPKIDPLSNYVTNALTKRPDVAEAKASIGAAKASVKSARINIYPRPVVSAEYQRQISGGFSTSGTQLIGGFAFSLFDGGANRAAYRAAKANQASAVELEKQAYRDIRTQVEQAYLNLNNARERLSASEVSLEAAKKNYDVQTDKYSQGLAITLDMLNAEVQVITAQTNEVQARYDYYTAVSQLDYAVGNNGGDNAK